MREETTPVRTSAFDPERLLVSLVALGTVAGLFLLRDLDDNRLTSWRWVFAGANPAALFALALGAIVLAHVAARWAVPRRASPAVLFVAACAVAACFRGEPEVIVDASRYFVQAKHLAVHGVRHFLSEWGREIPAWTDLPVVPLLHGLLFGVLGESRVHVQALTALLFAGTAVVTQRLGTALWGDEVGLAAGALLLAFPYLLTQVPLLLVDVPSMFFVALAVLAVTRAFQEGGAIRILLASAAVALALLSKYSAWVLLSVLPATGVVHRRARPGALRTGAAIALASAALVAAVVLPRRGAYAEQLALLASYQAPGLGRWGEGFASTFLFQIHPFVTVAALLSVGMAIRRRDARYVVVVWPVLLLAVLRVQRVRYWIPAFPMLALMAAYGLRALPRPEIRRHVVACAAATSLVVASHGFLRFLERTSAANLQAAGAYLDTLDEPEAEVVLLSRPDAEVNAEVSVPILDLFTTKKLVHEPAEASAQARERARDSPLRFTWEWRAPPFYAPRGEPERAALVVVSDVPDPALPGAVASRVEGRPPPRVFAADEGVFAHRTFVRVYRAAPTGTPRRGRPPPR
jgi:4-amino-4-deoxy-L-arabinose transferase-like glycosyltransferase